MKTLYVLLLTFVVQICLAQMEVDITKLSIPDEMKPDSNVQVYATIKNTGAVRLERTNCKLEVTCKSCPDKDAGKQFEYEKDLPQSTDSGKEYTFRWLIKTPFLPGEYKLLVAIKSGNSTLAEENVSVLIEENFELEITNDFDYIKFEPERKYPPYVIEVKNTGETQLTDGKYKIIVKNEEAPDEASDDDKSAFNLEKDIDLSGLKPGETKTVSSSSFTSPTAGGDYEYSITVEKDGKTFDAKGSEETIEIEVEEKEMEVIFTEKVTRKLYPEKEYPVSFTVKNSGDIKWEEGKYTIKSTLTSKASSKVDNKIFETEKSFNASEWQPGSSTTVTFPKIKAPIEHGKYTVNYTIFKDGKKLDIDDAEIIVNYQVVELIPELNVNRITLEKKMSPGKTYKVQVAVKNNGEIIALKNDWEVKCKIRSKKPSNYRPPRGVFDFSIDGVEIKTGGVKTITGSIKVPKIDTQITLKLDFEVYYKGSKMGGPKQYDITIKP